jgi:putative MATE family efflux protein
MQNFSSTLFKLWFPITLQQLIFAALNLLTVMFVGQLGETAVAAVGLANQVSFLFQLLLFGIGSGAAIFVAQFWGMRDLANIRRVLGIALALSLTGASVFAFSAFAFPDHILALYSADRAVIALGAAYLKILAPSYLAMAISASYAMTLRSTGNVRVPVTINITATLVGAGLNYALILGEWGLPKLGVIGSAVSANIARWSECLILLALIYATRSVVAARARELFAFDRAFTANIFKTILPVTLNEIFWSLGITTYSAIFGRVGTDAIAAVNIAGTIEMLAFVPFVGMANSAAIMIGHRIGADEEHRAFEYAKRFLIIVLILGTLIGAAIFFSADWILGFYKIDTPTRAIAREVLTVIAFALWIKCGNMICIVGILRAGGDARVSAIIDVAPLWLIGIPLASAGAFIFGLPAPIVYLLTISDELTKFILAATRVASKKWITNLARQHSNSSG